MFGVTIEHDVPNRYFLYTPYHPTVPKTVHLNHVCFCTGSGVWRAEAWLMKLYLAVLICVFCNVTAQLALKKGANSTGDGNGLFHNPGNASLWVETLVSWPVVAGILLWTVSTLTWIYILSGSELSFAYALYGLNYVLTPLAASWVFEEQMSPTQIAGMAFITLGVGLTASARPVS